MPLQRPHYFRHVQKPILMQHKSRSVTQWTNDNIGYLVHVFTRDNVVGNNACFILLQENIAEQLHVFFTMVRATFQTLRFDGIISVFLAPFDDQVVRLVTQEYICQFDSVLLDITVRNLTRLA